VAGIFDRFVAQDGQTLVEYALCLALVSVVAVGALMLIAGNLNDIFDEINRALGFVHGHCGHKACK
jgi:Flp pilus assembly pilin Flp